MSSRWISFRWELVGFRAHLQASCHWDITNGLSYRQHGYLYIISSNNIPIFTGEELGTVK